MKRTKYLLVFWLSILAFLLVFAARGRGQVSGWPYPFTATSPPSLPNLSAQFVKNATGSPGVFGSSSNQPVDIYSNNNPIARFYPSGGFYLGTSPSDPGAGNFALAGALQPGSALGLSYGGNANTKGAASVWSCVIPDTAATPTKHCYMQFANSGTAPVYFDEFVITYGSTCTTYPALEVLDVTKSTASSALTAVNGEATLSIHGSLSSAANNDTYAFYVTTTGSACSSTLATEFLELTVTMRD